MNYAAQSIRLSGHAREYTALRGFSEDEVAQTIREMPWNQTERGRLDARKDFLFEGIWNGRRYETKQVRPVFVVEDQMITVVTVYTYYF
jgi:hypothetical protein